MDLSRERGSVKEGVSTQGDGGGTSVSQVAAENVGCFVPQVRTDCPRASHRVFFVTKDLCPMVRICLTSECVVLLNRIGGDSGREHAGGSVCDAERASIHKLCALGMRGWNARPVIPGLPRQSTVWCVSVY